MSYSIIDSKILEIEIKTKKINKNAHLPYSGSEGAAAADLYATSSVQIAPHETEIVGTGIAVEIPQGFFGAIFARSGLASKSGLRPANCVGVIDSDYRGEIKVALHNDSDKSKLIATNERIAQLAILPYIRGVFKEVDELEDTERGEGGFGSTGK